ncbi:NAD(P)H-dependent oxidoreductase, partial [Pseudomonas sp. 2822-17]|uniref:NADPH-dependent FMN reductase n=1 Tax=Pseudomonas sp. 2822-17 TaxID=1712678 RepID=UPI00117A402D
MQGKTKPSIILINGSTNRESFTKKVLEKIESRLKENGAKTQLVNIHQLNLPVFA